MSWWGWATGSSPPAKDTASSSTTKGLGLLLNPSPPKSGSAAQGTSASGAASPAPSCICSCSGSSSDVLTSFDETTRWCYAQSPVVDNVACEPPHKRPSCRVRPSASMVAAVRDVDSEMQQAKVFFEEMRASMVLPSPFGNNAETSTSPCQPATQVCTTGPSSPLPKFHEDMKTIALQTKQLLAQHLHYTPPSSPCSPLSSPTQHSLTCPNNVHITHSSPTSPCTSSFESESPPQSSTSPTAPPTQQHPQSAISGTSHPLTSLSPCCDISRESDEDSEEFFSASD
ncbi:hypothetical protein Pelo_9857 [Pelomyxa schiedti]|nr:hypothetical protein Pelo_9857 [Pelomyxa schiedti]